MRISQLDDRRVALWGWGREGRASWRAIRSRLPQLPLTLFCSTAEATEAQALGDPQLTVETEATASRLSAFDVVVKSPGISPYRAEAGCRGAGHGFAAAPRCVCEHDGRAYRVRHRHQGQEHQHRVARAPAACRASHRTAATSACRCLSCWILTAARRVAIELSSYIRRCRRQRVRPQVAVALTCSGTPRLARPEARYVEDKRACWSMPGRASRC